MLEKNKATTGLEHPPHLIERGTDGGNRAQGKRADYRIEASRTEGQPLCAETMRNDVDVARSDMTRRTSADSGVRLDDV